MCYRSLSQGKTCNSIEYVIFDYIFMNSDGIKLNDIHYLKLAITAVP